MESIRELTTMPEIQRASDVLKEVWGGERDGMPAPLLRALQHAGSYVVGFFADDELVGASVAFFTAPAKRTMHSHITGLLPQYRGRGWGRLLKEHQREWALLRDVGTITWTFDPLVARNAHFNLRVLGARITEYLVNQYGPMDDGVNRGDQTDRLMASWSLASRGAETPSDDRVVASVAVPHDIEALRRAKSPEAAEWRLRVREETLALYADGLVIGGFDDERGYLFVRP